MNRLCIYHVFDKDGIVDDYVFYALDSFREICQHIIVTVNGIIGESYRSRLEESGITVMVRDNIGFDHGAWKDAILKYVLDSDVKYDELILTNDSYFGPFCKWSDIYSSMEPKKLDFWGITKGTSYDYGDIRVPVHIQSYFIAIGSRMLHSEDFRKYWVDLPYAQSFMDCVAKDEGLFAKHFEDLGYKWDVFCETNPEKTGLMSATYLFNSDDMLPYYGLPLVKKKTFVRSYREITEFGLGEDIPKSLNFIRNNIGYDTKMITDNILRLYPVEQINDACHPLFVIDSSGSLTNMGNRTVIISLDGVTDFRLYAGYINDISESVDVILAFTNEATMKLAEKMIVRKFVAKRVKSPTSMILFKECKDIVLKTDYVCFMRCTDALPSGNADIWDYALRKSLRNNGWDNLLFNGKYVDKLVEVMIENDIGLMIPPTPHNDVYLHLRWETWNSNIEIIRKIADNLELRMSPESTLPPFIANMFWCDTSVIRHLLEDNTWVIQGADGWDNMLVKGALDYLLPYIAQKGKKSVGVAFNEEYVKVSMRSHILAVDAIKKIKSNDMSDNNVIRFFSRHGRIFSLLDKFEKKFRIR